MQATATQTHVLMRFSKSGTEQARFTPDGETVHITFELVSRGKSQVRRQLRWGLAAARQVWQQLKSEGWKTFSEMFPATGPSYTGNYTGD